MWVMRKHYTTNGESLAMIILKEEINQLGAQITNLATWKLIAVGTFAVVGLLGWDNIVTDKKTGPLLLYSVGYLCAYIDCLYYRRATAIHVIAGYLRTYNGKDDEMVELCRYEKTVEIIRGKPSFFKCKRGGFFLSDKWPQFAASLLFTIGLPILSLVRYGCIREFIRDWKLAIPIVALVLHILLFILYEMKRKTLGNYFDKRRHRSKCLSENS
jgi:hypothetical protein